MIQEALRTRPAQTEQQPAYVECRECTDCGHVGINDAHPTDATCAMCDWSGPSPVEDQCPDCGKENAMGAACPKCSGRYRILAETHVAAPIAQTDPRCEQPDAFEVARHSKRLVEQLRAEVEAMRALLSKSLPVVEAHAGASHMLEGFRPTRNKWDELVDGIRTALAAKEA
jgi:hypothetical protein